MIFYRAAYSIVLRIIFISFLSVPLIAISGQDKKALEERKSQTQKDIEYTNSLLLETQKSKQSTLQRVRILDKRIQLRNEILNSISKEIEIVDTEIGLKYAMIEEMENDLEIIKQQYADLIVRAYWNRSRRDWLVYILSSENFNQAYRRMKYLQQFTRHRKEQAELIQNMKLKIVDEIEHLEEIKVQKEALALEKRNESRNLERERSGKSRLVSDLSKKEKELKKDIDEKRRLADKLEKEIAKIIAEEAKKSRSRNKYEQLTSEEKLIADNFQGNKGRLPWPVERGIITDKYGVHRHPVLKQLTIDNDGVDISTVKGAEARAVFEGEVTKVFAILGLNYTVIIRHGNFLSVYSNIVDLKVKQGDYVQTKQEIGTVFTDNETNSTVMKLQVWRERSILNPELWISK